MRKAQISTEFLIVISIAIFIFIIILGITLIKGIELNKLNNELTEKNECLKLSNLITYTLITGNNYTTTLNFNTTINPSMRIININNRVTCSMSTAAVNQATIPKGKIIITK